MLLDVNMLLDNKRLLDNKMLLTMLRQQKCC